MSRIPNRVSADSVVKGTTLTGYARSSEKSGWASINAQEEWLEEYAAERGLILSMIFSGVESGKMSAYRPRLNKAIEWARRRQEGIMACEPSRLMKAEDFDKCTNFDAVPLASEHEAFLARAVGVPYFATIVPPDATPHLIRSLRTIHGLELARRRGTRLGKLAVIDTEPDFAAQVLFLRQYGDGEFLLADVLRSERWIAKHLGLSSHRRVQSVLDAEVADGVRWRNLPQPYDVWLARTENVGIGCDAPAEQRLDHLVSTGTAHCEQCGREFRRRRKDHRYCSNKCRQAAHRQWRV